MDLLFKNERQQGGSRNLAGIQIGDGKNEIVVVPVEVSAIDRELLEAPLVEIASNCRMVRLAEERLEVHRAFDTIVERDPQTVVIKVFDLGDVDVVLCARAHFTRLVMR